MVRASISDAFADEGHIDGTLMARVGGHWIPLTVDVERLEHTFGGFIASGNPVRLLLPASHVAPSLFRLELPCRGDVSRAFIRWLEPSVNADRGSLDYKEAPFLLFIGDVLCVRRLPPWAIVPSVAHARSDGAWERMSLCCDRDECDECDGTDGPPPSTAANLVFTFSLRSGSWPVSFHSGCFVRYPADSGTGPATAPVRFAFVRGLQRSAAAERQHHKHASDAAVAPAMAIAAEVRVRAGHSLYVGTVGIAVRAVAIAVGLSFVATIGLSALGIVPLIIALLAFLAVLFMLRGSKAGGEETRGDRKNVAHTVVPQLPGVQGQSRERRDSWWSNARIPAVPGLEGCASTCQLLDMRVVPHGDYSGATAAGCRHGPLPWAPGSSVDLYEEMGMRDVGKMYVVIWINIGSASVLSVSEVLDRDQFEACLVEDFLGRRLKFLLNTVATSLPFVCKEQWGLESVGSFFGQGASISRSQTAAGIDHAVLQVDLYSKWRRRVAMQNIGFMLGNVFDIVLVDSPGQAVIMSCRLIVTPELKQFTS